MARITTFSEVTSTQGTTALEDEDVFLLDGSNGSKKITAKELAQAMADKLPRNAPSVGYGYGKSCFYRGADLGSGATFAAASTADQRAAIDNGSFAGLFIGDYWTVNGKIYRIADFNYWRRAGSPEFTANHVILVPDDGFSAGKMNNSAITTGAYVNSVMYSDTTTPSSLNAARTRIATDFGGYLVTHKEYLENATTDGAASGGAWYDSTVELMNECMLYGAKHFGKPYNGTYQPTISKSQLALFRLNPVFMNIGSGTWLRDVANASQFCRIAGAGTADRSNAGNALVIRPVFAIKGTTS